MIMRTAKVEAALKRKAAEDTGKDGLLLLLLLLQALFDAR
jgi:hypothetical protein